MKIGVGINIATWCFDKKASARAAQMDQLERVFPRKYARFLQSGYTHGGLFPWYDRPHEEVVIKELIQRGWSIVWCLTNDNPLDGMGLSLSGGDRLGRIGLAIRSPLSYLETARLIIEEWKSESERIRRLTSERAIFEMVNADVDFSPDTISFWAETASLIDIPSYYLQGLFVYDYRRLPSADVRVTGWRPGNTYVSEFGVEASVDSSNMADRMRFILGAAWGISDGNVLYLHEYVSRAWGYDLWRKDGETQVLWDAEKYKLFLRGKSQDVKAPHSRYVTILYPEVLGVLR